MLCAGVIALCCAVSAVLLRLLNSNILVHTTNTAVVHRHKKRSTKTKMEKQDSSTIMLYKMLDDMLLIALANSVCLLALSRSDRPVLGLLLCAGLIALRCAVLCFACVLLL